MNYPMVFYPKAIADFSRRYPLRLSQATQVLKSHNRSPPAVLPKPPKPLVVLSVQWLGLIWLSWFGGALAQLSVGIALLLLAVSWGWSWLELLLLVGAYSCLMAAVYTNVLSRRRQLLSQYRQQILENREHGVKSLEHLPLFDSPPQPLSVNSQWRGQALADLMSSRVSPIGRSNVRQGVSEAQFLRNLQCYFPNTVQGVEFKIPMSKKRYSADFIIVHSLSGIGIDVEIDEPYAGCSKKPTHCWDEDNDRRRNQLFNEWGWIVVRFTEKQVVQAPLSCCKFIAQVIAQVTGDISYLEPLQNEPDLLPVKPWTVKESRWMAREKYRRSYLSKQRDNE